MNSMVLCTRINTSSVVFVFINVVIGLVFKPRIDPLLGV